ncbi:MAG: hypothetical protein WCH34_06795 [Bacteroidota bacterium]
MKKIWLYLSNQFLIATRRNFRKAYKLSREHDSRVKNALDNNPADEDYQIIYNRYHPLHEDLSVHYSNWASKGGMQKGDTLNLKQLLKLLPAKMHRIDVRIQIVHEPETQAYEKLFPQMHKPFYSGTQDSRILAVKTLITTIGDEVALAAVKADLIIIYNALESAKKVQTGAKKEKKTSSSTLEDSRVAAMTCMYQDLGLLINKFPSKPNMIEPFFDVETLTNPEQTIWKGQLDAKEVLPVLVHTFAAGDIIRLKSTGKGDIDAYLASTPGGTDSVKLSTTAKHEIRFDVAQFRVSNYKENRYLTLINASANEDTRFIIELY